MPAFYGVQVKSAPHQPVSSGVAILAGALVAFGVFLRVGFLGVDSLWLDEAFSVSLASHYDAADLLTRVRDPVHPPLYYVILRGALHVAGVSEAAARAPSALASVLNLGLLFILAKRLGVSRPGAGLAVVLLALAPIDIWYAQETRMYALVTMAALIFAIGLTVSSWAGAVLAAMGLTAGLYLDFTMVPLSLALTSVWLVRWWYTGKPGRELVRIVLASLAGWWLFRPLWPQLVDVVYRIDHATFFSRLRLLMGVSSLAGPPILAALMVVIIGLIVLSAAAYQGLRNDRFRRHWDWIVPSAFVLATAGLTLPRAYSAKQVLVTGWPFIAILTAWTLADRHDGTIQPDRRVTAARLRLPATVAVSLVAAILAVASPRADWRGVVAFLNRQGSSQAIVWLDPPWNDIPYDYYRPNLPAITNPAASFRPAGGEPSRAVDVCLVAERYGATPPTSPSEAWLDSHLPLLEATPFARLEVRCYGNR